MPDAVVLFFLLGLFARLVKSDLRLPEALYETLSIYLLLAIGLKGGIELSRQPMLALLPQILACMALGFAIPLVLTPLLRLLGLSCCCTACCMLTRRRWPCSNRATARQSGLPLGLRHGCFREHQVGRLRLLRVALGRTRPALPGRLESQPDL